MTRIGQSKNFFILAAALIGLLTPCIVQAQVLVTGAASPVSGGALFQYNYTISNNTPNDLVVVDIHVTPGMGSIVPGSIIAPNDFVSAFDPGLGLVSFLENTVPFGAAPLSGFSFRSNLRPGNSTFDATQLTPAGSLTVSSGSVTSAVGAAVPEPGSLAWLGVFAAGGSLVWIHRRPNKHSRKAQ